MVSWGKRWKSRLRLKAEMSGVGTRHCEERLLRRSNLPNWPETEALHALPKGRFAAGAR